MWAGYNEAGILYSFITRCKSQVHLLSISRSYFLWVVLWIIELVRILVENHLERRYIEISTWFLCDGLSHDRRITKKMFCLYRFNHVSFSLAFHIVMRTLSINVAWKFIFCLIHLSYDVENGLVKLLIPQQLIYRS